MKPSIDWRECEEIAARNGRSDLLNSLFASKTREPYGQISQYTVPPLVDSGPQRTLRGIVGTIKKYDYYTCDEISLLQEGLDKAGYAQAGRGAIFDDVDLVKLTDELRPEVLLMQERMYWKTHRHYDCPADAWFTGVLEVGRKPDLFRAVVYRDVCHCLYDNHLYHVEFNPHAYVVYYHPWIVRKLCPWILTEQMVRTHHSINPDDVPEFDPDRQGGTIITGAKGLPAYHLRTPLIDNVRFGRWGNDVTYVQHPGYDFEGSNAARYMKMLSGYRVAICTTSMFGFAVKKIIEATAAGCIVITDLPAFDSLGPIDDNLVRIPVNADHNYVRRLCVDTANHWDAKRQHGFACHAIQHFNHIDVAQRLAADLAEKREELL